MNRPVIVALLTAVAVTGCTSANVSGQAGHGRASAPAGSAAASTSPPAQAAALAAPPSGWGSRPPGLVTPGAAGHSRAAICPQVSATLAVARPGTAAVAKVFAEYGIAPGLRHRYRIDQLVPLDLDGTNSIRNLWPQPAEGFKVKNRLEARLHVLVCASRISLAAAQRAIRQDWTRAYPRYLYAPGPPPPPGAPLPGAPPPPPGTSPPPPGASPPAGPPPQASCHPLTSTGHCYEPGEFCSAADHGLTGLAGDGKTIVCLDNDGWRWEPQ
jgi:hypothetical protein